MQYQVVDTKFIFIFFIAIYLIVRFLPPSRFRTFLFTTRYGPILKEGVSRSRYALLWSFYAFKWALLIGVILFLDILMMGFVQEESSIYMLFVVLFFVIALLFLLSVFGGLFCVLGALWYGIVDKWRN